VGLKQQDFDKDCKDAGSITLGVVYTKPAEIPEVLISGRIPS